MNIIYSRNTYREVNLAQIQANYKNLSKIKPVICVVKNNAYNLGLLEVTAALINAGASIFAVFTVDEAVSIRVKYPMAKVLILGFVSPDDIDTVSKLNISVIAYDIRLAEELSHPY
jgi:alanine racemase